MKKELLFLFVGMVFVVSLGILTKTQDVQAGALVFPTITPGSSYGGTVTSYTASFMVTSSTEVAAQIRLIFPSSFTVSGATATSTITASSTGSVVVGSSTVSGSEITIWLADGSVTPASETIEIAGIPNILSPYAGGSFTVGIETRTLADELSDAASSSAFTIIPAVVRTPTADAKPPVSKIAAPVSGETIANNKRYTINGTGKDAEGSAIQQVEVSVDGGKTWGGGTVTALGGSYSWEYVWENPTGGEYTIQVRATDAKGNRETPAAGVKVQVAGLVSEISTPTPTPTPTPAAATTVQALQLQVISLQQQVVALLQQLLQLLTGQR